MKIDQLVAKYIEGRDRKTALKAEFDAKVSKIDAIMDKIEGKFLEVLDANGLDNMKCEFGTAMIVDRTSVSIGDKDAFLDYIKAHDEWPLLQVTPSKAAVVEFKEAAGGELPPGINWRSERVVQIRRAS